MLRLGQAYGFATKLMYTPNPFFQNHLPQESEGKTQAGEWVFPTIESKWMTPSWGPG